MTHLLVWQIGPVQVTAEVPAATPLAAWVRRLYPDACTHSGAGAHSEAAPDAAPHADSHFRRGTWPSGPVVAHESILLEGGTDGFHLSRGDRTTGPLSPEDAFVAFELELSRALLEHQPTLPLHGGGAAGSGGAVLLSGPGESGKSTLTVSLARAGYRLFGDDVVLVDGASGYIHPFPRLLKLTEPARSRLVTPEEGRQSRHFPLVDSTLIHPRSLGSGWSPPAPVAAVVFPRRDPDWQDDPRWEPVPGGKAMALLMDQRLFPVRKPGRDFQILADAVATATTVAVRYREAAQLVEQLREWLGAPIPYNTPADATEPEDTAVKGGSAEPRGSAQPGDSARPGGAPVAEDSVSTAGRPPPRVSDS